MKKVFKASLALLAAALVFSAKKPGGGGAFRFPRDLPGSIFRSVLF